MGRRGRQWQEHGLYHVFARGSNRCRLIVDDGDLADLEHLILEALVKTGVDAFAWALMPNHWHALVRCPDDEAGVSPFMQRVNHRHSLRSNRRWNRRAHLFENRFGCVAQESEEQLRWTLRYIVRNPLEAGLCGSMEEARWTSYRETAGLVRAPIVLRIDQVLQLFDDDPDVARDRYRAFVCSTDTPSLPDIAAATPDACGKPVSGTGVPGARSGAAIEVPRLWTPDGARP